MDRFSQSLWGEDKKPKQEQDEIEQYKLKRELDENEEDRES